jgi:hypothetical protein
MPSSVDSTFFDIFDTLFPCDDLDLDQLPDIADHVHPMDCFMKL